MRCFCRRPVPCQTPGSSISLRGSLKGQTFPTQNSWMWSIWTQSLLLLALTSRSAPGSSLTSALTGRDASSTAGSGGDASPRTISPWKRGKGTGINCRSFSLSKETAHPSSPRNYNYCTAKACIPTAFFRHDAKPNPLLPGFSWHLSWTQRGKDSAEARSHAFRSLIVDC